MFNPNYALEKWVVIFLGALRVKLGVLCVNFGFNAEAAEFHAEVTETKCISTVVDIQTEPPQLSLLRNLG